MKIKIQLTPSYWPTPNGEHWCWVAEQIERYADPDKFDFFFTLEPFLRKDRDLMYFWDVVNVPKHLPANKLCLVAHSDVEARCLRQGIGYGVTSWFLKDKYYKDDMNVHVLPYGIDSHIFQPLPREKSPKIRFGWVGNRIVKGWEHVGHLLDREDICFAPLVVDYDEDCRNKNIFCPRILYGMPNYYRKIDVLIVASGNHEGFCRPIIEAGACGLPVISTNVGIAREFIGDNEGGVVVNDVENPTGEIEAAISYFIDNPTEVEKMGKRNRELVLTDWTWEKRIKAYERFFEEAYEKSRHQS